MRASTLVTTESYVASGYHKNSTAPNHSNMHTSFDFIKLNKQNLEYMMHKRNAVENVHVMKTDVRPKSTQMQKDFNNLIE